MKKYFLSIAIAVVFGALCIASTIMVDKNLTVLKTKDQIFVLVQRGTDGKVIREAPIKNDIYNEVQIRTKKLQDRVEKE